MEDRWLVKLPPEAEPPITVFVNGVLQAEGHDYTVQKGHLVFSKAAGQGGPPGLLALAADVLRDSGYLPQK